MEELRSTEIIDKEIIAEAQKKAERIVLKAQEECRRIASSVEERVQNEARVTENNFNIKIENFKRDLQASVNLENSRFYVSFVQDSLVKNINEYLSSVNEDKLIDLLAGKVEKIDFKDYKFDAYVYGFDRAKCEKTLKGILGENLLKVEDTKFNKIIYEESFLSDQNNRGIILLSENGEIKCRFTLCSLMEEILDRNRNELSEALFGSEGAEE